jgi:hypothetical protein
MKKTDRLVLAQALDWANRHLKEYPQAQPLMVAGEAAVKFGLSPIEEEWLLGELRNPTSAA